MMIKAYKKFYKDDGYGGKETTKDFEKTFFAKTSPLMKSEFLKEYGRMVKDAIVVYTSFPVDLHGEYFLEIDGVEYTVFDKINDKRKSVYICEVYVR